jgi:hypothetical protein
VQGYTQKGVKPIRVDRITFPAEERQVMETDPNPEIRLPELLEDCPGCLGYGYKYVAETPEEGHFVEPLERCDICGGRRRLPTPWVTELMRVLISWGFVTDRQRSIDPEGETQ